MPEEEIVYGYVYYLIDQALNSKMSTKAVLGALRDLCRIEPMSKNYLIFTHWLYAQQELEDVGEQFYWEGANNDNINTIINAEFLDWKCKYESMQVK